MAEQCRRPSDAWLQERIERLESDFSSPNRTTRGDAAHLAPKFPEFQLEGIEGKAEIGGKTRPGAERRC